MAETLPQKVRQAASKLGDFSFGDLASALNAHENDEKLRLREVVKNMKRTKEIIILRRGFYRYNFKQKPLTKIAKMWRAMRIKEYFTRRDIERLSGASNTYVRKYFIHLKKAGFIYRVSDNGHKADLFGLVEPDKAPLQHPVPPNLKKEKSHV
jgi:Fic family protein